MNCANMETGEPLAVIRDQVQSANAYIGAEPIVEALGMGADVIVTGRSTDTALTYGPLMHEFGWAPTITIGSRRGSSPATSTSVVPSAPGATASSTGGRFRRWRPLASPSWKSPTMAASW